MENQGPQQVVVTPTKSMGLAILLTVLFGPIGMFYSTIWGAIIMVPISAVVIFFTFGIGVLVTWPICIIWTAVATSSHNKKLLSGQKKY